MLTASGPAAGQGTTVGGSGTQYFLNDSSTGKANVELVHGEADDEVYAGDWDGTDTLLVRRGNTLHVRNSATSGPADVVFSYGDPGDTVLVGDWDGRGGDTLVVRRGSHYFVKNDLATGVASGEFAYGEPGDAVLVGRWSAGQAGDTLGVRRGAAPPPAVPQNPGDTVDCPHFATQAQAQEWFLRHYPSYGDVANLDADDDGRACEYLP